MSGEDSFTKHTVGLPDGLYTIEFEKKTSKRSTQQNRYYWLYYGLLGKRREMTR